MKRTKDYGLYYYKHDSQFFTTDPTHDHLGNIKQPYSYASSFFPGDAHVNLHAFADADFANNVDNRRSITGYVFFLAGAPLSWNCMTQHTTALSTMEAEYYAVCKAVQESLYLRMLFSEVGMKVQSPLIIREDNRACIAFSKDPGEHKRTKHIDYRHHFIREQVTQGEVVLEPVSTVDQIADIFTKAFDKTRFEFLRDHLVKSKKKVMKA